MKIETIPVPRQMLLRMPENERYLFLLAGHVLNELTILSKLAVFTGVIPSAEILSQAAIAQAFLILKIEIGKVFEGWEMLRKRYFGTGLSKDYDSQLDNEAKQASQKLRAYFNASDNILRATRNKFSFHYFDESLGAALDELPDGEGFEMHLADNDVNSLFYFSEVVVGTAMFKNVGPGDVKESFQILHRETVIVQKWLTKFLMGIVTVAALRHLENDQITQEVEIGDVVRIDEVSIPFFVDTSHLEANK